MALKTLAIIFGIALIFAYLVLCYVAYRHVKSDKKDKWAAWVLLATDLWWPTYEDLYDDVGRKMCTYGKILMPLIVVFYVFLFTKIL